MSTFHNENRLADPKLQERWDSQVCEALKTIREAIKAKGGLLEKSWYRCEHVRLEHDIRRVRALVVVGEAVVLSCHSCSSVEGLRLLENSRPLDVLETAWLLARVRPS